MERDLQFDEGHTALVGDELQRQKNIFWQNGTGDDVLDAVAMSLGYEENIVAEPTMFDDPLAILIAEEDEDE